jgi:hypothetical protein
MIPYQSLDLHRCKPSIEHIPNTKNTILLDVGLRNPNQDKSMCSFRVLSVRTTRDPYIDLRRITPMLIAVPNLQHYLLWT